jgi:hypothetical protein
MPLALCQLWYVWYSLWCVICYTCDAGCITSVWWWCTVQLVLCQFWYTRYKVNHTKLCLILNCAVSYIICYIWSLRNTHSCILIIFASDLPIKVLVLWSSSGELSFTHWRLPNVTTLVDSSYWPWIKIIIFYL